MPSLKCYQCNKVKRCKLHVDQRDQSAGCDDHDSCLRGPCNVKIIVYLCAPCARELGR